jgi:hypothetical protein
LERSQPLSDGAIATALCEQNDHAWSNMGDPRIPSTAHRPFPTYKH